MKNIAVKFAGLSVMLAMMIVISDAALYAHEEDESPYKPVVDTYEVMDLLFDPVYHDLQEAMKEEPAERKGWKAIYDGAAASAELSNLLFFRDSAEYESTQEWEDLTIATRDAAVALRDSVRSMDWAEVSGKYAALIESCNACHTKFEPDVAPVLEK